MDSYCTILIDDGPWRIACVTDGEALIERVDTPADAELADKARAAAHRVREMDGGHAVLVALPSSQCLAATIDTNDLNRSGRRQAMAYLLEEQLPISAEDSVADYAESQGLAMGVCAELDAIRPIVDALEAEELLVRHICPAAILTAMHLVELHPDADGLLIRPPVTPPMPDCDEHSEDKDAPTYLSLDVIELSRKHPVHWWWLTDEPSLISRLDAWRKRLSGAMPKLVTLGQPIVGNDIDSVAAETIDADHAVALIGAKVLDGEVSPWIDLRRDALAPPSGRQLYQRQAGAFAASFMILLVCIIGTTFWRGGLYQQQANEFADQQVEVYKVVFPDQRVPSAGSIGRRLRQEQAKLEGIGGKISKHEAEALYPTSALTHLHAVLASLPRGARYQISDLSIEPGLIRLNGTAASHVVAEQVAGAVKSTGRYSITPPNSRALSGFGVSFGFTAKPQTPAEGSP